MFNSFIAGNGFAASILLTLYNLTARIEGKVLGNQAVTVLRLKLKENILIMSSES